MIIKKFLILFFLHKVNSFQFTKSFFQRNSIISLSHFSKIQTQITDKKILIQSLLDINPYLIIDDKPSLILGYNGNEAMADVIIRQDNGMDIGFTLKDGKYQLVTDLQFWYQKIPPELFLERLAQKYSINCILETLDEEGFYTDCLIYNNETSCIELQASRYKF
tara:strand:- start:3240 stop:3731 length:492 start_codon:yes stop_codon:yes gene_type:complete